MSENGAPWDPSWVEDAVDEDGLPANAASEEAHRDAVKARDAVPVNAAERRTKAREKQFKKTRTRETEYLTHPWDLDTIRLMVQTDLYCKRQASVSETARLYAVLLDIHRMKASK